MNQRWIGLTLLALAIAAGCGRQRPDAASAPGTGALTRSSFDRPASTDRVFPAHGIKLVEAGLDQVLALYADISGRSIIRGAKVPDAKFTFSNQTPMGVVEVLRAFDTLLAAQGITTVLLGTRYVKVVPAKDAASEPGPLIELPPKELPDSSSFLIYIVKTRRVTPQQAVAALQPFAGLPNSIIALGSGGASRPAPKAGLPSPSAIFGPKEDGFLILRDYSSNVRRMLEVLAKLEEK